MSIYKTKRNNILKEIKEDLTAYLFNQEEIKIFLESEFESENFEEDYIVISKNSENLENLSLNCKEKQRFLNIQITFYKQENLEKNEEDDEIVDKIEEFLINYKKHKITITQLDFDYNLNSSNLRTFVTNFNVEIVYIL